MDQTGSEIPLILQTPNSENRTRKTNRLEEGGRDGEKNRGKEERKMDGWNEGLSGGNSRRELGLKH